MYASDGIRGSRRSSDGSGFLNEGRKQDLRDEEYFAFLVWLIVSQESFFVIFEWCTLGPT